MAPWIADQVRNDRAEMKSFQGAGHLRFFGKAVFAHANNANSRRTKIPGDVAVPTPRENIAIKCIAANARFYCATALFRCQNSLQGLSRRYLPVLSGRGVLGL